MAHRTTKSQIRLKLLKHLLMFLLFLHAKYIVYFFLPFDFGVKYDSDTPNKIFDIYQPVLLYFS